MAGSPKQDKPTSHGSTSALLAVGFGLITLALLGKALTATNEASRFNLAFAAVIVCWAGAALFLVHRRWVKSLDAGSPQR